MHARPNVKCLHTDSVGVTWLCRIAPAASLPSSAAQCSLACDGFLMTGCKHDEMFRQHRLCHHHLHIFTLTGGVRGQTPDGIKLKKPATASLVKTSLDPQPLKSQTTWYIQAQICGRCHCFGLEHDINLALYKVIFVSFKRFIQVSALLTLSVKIFNKCDQTIIKSFIAHFVPLQLV